MAGHVCVIAVVDAHVRAVVVYFRVDIVLVVADTHVRVVVAAVHVRVVVVSQV